MYVYICIHTYTHKCTYINIYAYTSVYISDDESEDEEKLTADRESHDDKAAQVARAWATGGRGG